MLYSSSVFQASLTFFACSIPCGVSSGSAVIGDSSSDVRHLVVLLTPPHKLSVAVEFRPADVVS